MYKLIGILSFAAATLLAQQVSDAVVVGTVLDQSQGAVNGTVITLKNVATVTPGPSSVAGSASF